MGIRNRQTVTGHTNIRRWLLANALFSIDSGLLLIIAGGWTAAALGVLSVRLLFWIGWALLLFGLGVALASRSQRTSRQAVSLIAGLDWSWVMGTVLLALVWALSPELRGLLSTQGILLVLGSSVPVTLFSPRQRRWLREVGG